MRLRRLQRQDEQGQWYDDAYTLEDSQGQITFCYNLTWDRVGSAYNGKLQETGVALEAIETVLQPGDKFQWLPVEIVPEGEATAYYVGCSCCGRLILAWESTSWNGVCGELSICRSGWLGAITRIVLTFCTRKENAPSTRNGWRSPLYCYGQQCFCFKNKVT